MSAASSREERSPLAAVAAMACVLVCGFILGTVVDDWLDPSEPDAPSRGRDREEADRISCSRVGGDTESQPTPRAPRPGAKTVDTPNPDSETSPTSSSPPTEPRAHDQLPPAVRQQSELLARIGHPVDPSRYQVMGLLGSRSSRFGVRTGRRRWALNGADTARAVGMRHPSIARADLQALADELWKFDEEEYLAEKDLLQLAWEVAESQANKPADDAVAFFMIGLRLIVVRAGDDPRIADAKQRLDDVRKRRKACLTEHIRRTSSD